MAVFRIQTQTSILTPRGETIFLGDDGATKLELRLMSDDLGYPYKCRLLFALLDESGGALYRDSAYHSLILEGEAYKKWKGGNKSLISWAAEQLGVEILDELIPEQE